MFQSLVLHGTAGSLLLGYRDAVVLRAWSIQKIEQQWTLTATVARVDPYLSRQKPLLFTAPRKEAHDGFWAWGVEGDVQFGDGRLLARLGPPEQ